MYTTCEPYFAYSPPVSIRTVTEYNDPSGQTARTTTAPLRSSRSYIGITGERCGLDAPFGFATPTSRHNTSPSFGALRNTNLRKSSTPRFECVARVSGNLTLDIDESPSSLVDNCAVDVLMTRSTSVLFTTMTLAEMTVVRGAFETKPKSVRASSTAVLPSLLRNFISSMDVLASSD